MASSRLEEHIQRVQRLRELRKSDPAGTRLLAAEAATQAAELRSNDPRRGDALALLAWLRLEAGDYAGAAAVTTEVLRIRERSEPDEFLALALGAHALALFGADRSAEADGMLRRELEVWERIFGRQDPRLAAKLEAQAEYVQSGWGRPYWAIELLQRAIRIREVNPEGARGGLAMDYQRLAQHQNRPQ
ncbi:MAG: hypothetical protein ABI787_09285 [Spartobacteria bacterium]